MAEDKGNRINEEAYRRYLSGNMTPAERHAFEKALLNDPFAQEALDGMESLDPELIIEDVKELKAQLAQRTQKKEQPLFWKIAASLVLLGIFSFVIYFLIDTVAPTELAQEKEVLSEKVDTKDTTEIEADSVLAEKPDQIIAFQQPLNEEKPTRSREVPESKKIEEKATAVDEEMEVLLDIKEPEERSSAKLSAKGPEENIAEIPATTAEPAVIAEMKKSEASPAQKRKIQSSGQREVAGTVATVSAERTLSGRVTSADDDSPLPGVNVIIKGSTAGAVTDIDGNFEIPISSGSSPTLVFNSVGYVSEEVEVSGESRVDITLNSDVTALSEIVVTGSEVSTDRNTAYSYSPPKPTGGQAKFNDYIKDNLRYPASELAAGVKGAVKIQFTIAATGNMTNFSVIRGLGEDFDKEALRLIQDGPRWEPGEENGTRVTRDVKVTIRFKPPER